MSREEIKFWKNGLKDLFHKYKYVLMVAVAGIVLLLLPSTTAKTGEGVDTEEVVQLPSGFSTPELEGRLEEVLSQIDGAGEVSVLLTIKSGPQSVLAQDSDTAIGQEETQSTLSTVVISRGSGNEETVTIQQLSPQYLGALVVCSGGDDPEVRLRLVEAVSALTGLGADRISVCRGK